ncbi:MAG: flagellar M-ring protein FliF [Deltaproteobacteria bacterium]|nr:flagellar M-ring protein FliF [Deltaproteobacteria bacterium]
MEKIKQSFSELLLQLKTILKDLTLGKKIALFALVGSTILGFIFLIIWTEKPDFQLLYSNLAPEDAGAILTKLKEQKIQYQIASNGNSILIPKERIYEIRMELASQGLPQGGGGVGFEIFDNTKLGMTEFVQNVNYQRALQGELSRTINRFAEVESSRVHIVMQSKSLFVEDEEPATASVVLKISNGKRLSKDQVQGIVHLVSSSISGLNPKNVTVVDDKGKILEGLKDKSTMERVSSDQLGYQEKVERRIENRIQTMLEGALGAGKAIVRVSCDLNFRKQEKTEELYKPDNKVIRSEQIFNETSNETKTGPAGIPGVLTNINVQTGKTKKTIQSGGLKFQKQDKTVNYEIGKILSHTVESIGKINRISVAVIVDGTYKNIKGEDGNQESQYLPRTTEGMAKLANLVKRAVNFDTKRGDKLEIVNIPFKTAEMAEGKESVIEEGWLSDLKQYTFFIKYIFLSIILLLCFIFVVRPLVAWLTSSQIEGSMEMLNQLPKTVGEIESESAQGMKNLPFRDQALEMITKDNAYSVPLMQNWLKEK